MLNEFGVALDSNGYAPSIMPPGEGCFICGRQGDTVRHEIFHGPYRQKSKALGLWVRLCPDCHMTLHAGKRGYDGLLKAHGCRDAKMFYGWSEDEFRRRFGKDYYDQVQEF